VTNANKCDTSLDPALQEPSTNVVNVTIATDAFPQPHKGDPITLSGGKLTLSIPADLLQVGVDAGLITDGMSIPSTVTLVLAGSNTTQGTHTYTANQTIVVHVNNGVAQALSSTINLPNTTWTPKNDVDDVFFTEKSLKIVSTIPIIGGVTATFDCAPNGTATVLGLSAQGSEPPVNPTGSTTTTVATTGTTTAPAGTGTTGTSSGTLPRTGGSALFLAIIAAVLIDLGLAAVAFSRRRYNRA
jgi:hypothetical protein